MRLHDCSITPKDTEIIVGSWFTIEAMADIYGIPMQTGVPKDSGRMNHKRGRSKAQRSGCLMCKPYKLNQNKTSARMQGHRHWQEHEVAAETDGKGHRA